VDNRTEQLADGLWRVEVGFLVNAYVIANDGRSDGEGLTLVDTGTAAGGPRLVRSLRMLGLDPRAAALALLTHWHSDHAGSAARFAASSAGTRVQAGAVDLPVVTGAQAPPSPDPSRSTRLARAFARTAKPPRPTPGATPLDGDIPGGLQVVPTPGHTLGHVSFWLPDQGVLLAGDAVMNLWRLVASPAPLTADRTAARASVRTLAALPVGTLAVGHGPPVTRHARRRLEALAERLKT
jgi:glyoxylase-like metal-dependent hydrolase (beta-lactamase superfamily II)